MRLIRLFLAFAIMLGLGAVTAVVWLVPAPRWRRRRTRSLRQTWARAMLWLLRVRVRVEPPDADLSGTALYVANHTSYLDILVLMSRTPGVFVSKLGIIWWPVVGQIACLGETLFVNRNNRLGVGRLVEKVRKRLGAGGSVVFFPEATSSNGDTLLPFKSSLFAAADDGEGRLFAIRPLVVRYESIGGRPVDRSNRDRIYWYDDMLLPPHTWGLLAAPGIDVVVRVLPERMLSGPRGRFARDLRREMLKEIRIPGTVA